MKTFKAVAVLTGKNHGYFDNRRVYDGEELEVTEAQFSDSWMKRVRKAQEPKPQKVDTPKEVETLGTGLL